MNADVRVEDNTGACIAAMKAKVARALEIVGGTAETNVKALTPVDTGDLRNSFTHSVSGNQVTIGSNMEYAPYVELGTGKLYSPPPEWMSAQGQRGRGLDHWIYQGRDGKWHMGFPREGKHMLQNGISNNLGQYKGIIESELKG